MTRRDQNTLAVWLAAGLDDAALCEWLGVNGEVLTRLKCCGAPRNAEDVRAIAERYGVEVSKLAEVCR